MPKKLRHRHGPVSEGRFGVRGALIPCLENSVCFLLLLVMGLMLFVDAPVSASEYRFQYLYDLSGPGADGTFKNPRDTYFEPSRGEIYVADTGNNRIQIFNRDGVRLYSFGPGSGLETPVSVAADPSGVIYVISIRGGHSPVIERYSFRGDRMPDLELHDYPGEHEGITVVPADLYLESDGDLLVTDRKGARVLVFDQDGSFRYEVVPDPSSVQTDVIRGGEFQMNIGAVWTVADSPLFVLNPLKSYIAVFNRKGNMIRRFGTKGGGPRKLSFPTGIAGDSKDRIYVADKHRHTIVVFDQEGKFLHETASVGSGPGEFYFPHDVMVDDLDRLYVSQGYLSRIQVLKLLEIPGKEGRR